MKRVTGIGGIFFSAMDPVALRAWYKQHLRIDVQPWGGAAFDWADAAGNPTKGTTAWLIDPADVKHFAPSKSADACGFSRHRLVQGFTERCYNVSHGSLAPTSLLPGTIRRCFCAIPADRSAAKTPV